VLVQIRSIQNTEKEEVTDAGRGHLVRHDLDYDVHILDTMVRESRPLSSLWHSESESIYSSIPPLWPLIALYLFWMRFLDRSPEHGGRISHWFRSARFFKYFAEYYPSS
jgi:Diacylglycerol acyltransferase